MLSGEVGRVQQCFYVCYLNVGPGELVMVLCDPDAITELRLVGNKHTHDLVLDTSSGFIFMLYCILNNCIAVLFATCSGSTTSVFR